MKYFLVILLLICLGSNLSAQDFRFSQFDLNPIYMNPAYSGSQKDLRIGINYRNQWFNVPGRSLPGPLSSYNLVLDKRFGNVLVGGLSANIFQSFKGEGQYKHTHAGFNYSWHLPTRNEDFSMFFGAGFSYNNIGVDFSRLIFTDQIDAQGGYLNTPSAFIPSAEGVRNYFDMSGGTVLKVNMGRVASGEFSFSVNHLTSPNVSLNSLEEKLARKYTSFGSLSFRFKNSGVYLNPKVMIEIQAPFSTYTLGSSVYITKRNVYNKMENFSKPLYFGVYFQASRFELLNTNSMILMLGHTGFFGISSTRYQFGFSADVNLGGLNMRSNITGEISMNIIFDKNKNKRNKSRRGDVKCPLFKGNPLSPF